MIILFKKIPIMNGKSKFCKIKGRVCNILTDAANIWNILPRLAVCNELIVLKLKRDLKYRIHVYSELVCPHIVHQELTYLKSYDNFFENLSITKCFLSVDMIKFSDLLKFKNSLGELLKNLFLREKKWLKM